MLMNILQGHRNGIIEVVITMYVRMRFSNVRKDKKYINIIKIVDSSEGMILTSFELAYCMPLGIFNVMLE